MDITRLVRPTIARMHGYVPGEQPAATQRIIKLNTNENPFPPSPEVMRAIADIDPEALRRYPSARADAFCHVVAKLLDVSADMILTGNGSDDVLAIITQAVFDAGETLAYPDPTYSLYPVLADLCELKLQAVPWNDGWKLPTDELLALKPRAIYLANPNAPSGTMTSLDGIGALCRRLDGLVLVDEAYVDFAEFSALPLLRDHPNLVITRSLSKGYSLAGIRFGFAVGHPDLIAQLHKARDSYPNDAISIVASVAALRDQEYARVGWEHVRAERQRMTEGLTKLGFNVIPSQANFVLASVPGEADASMLYQQLKQGGILVRYFSTPGLNDKLRITIGTTDENDALLAALGKLLAESPKS